jgi:hypothetical protein
MAELTGDAPLGEMARPPSRPIPPSPAAARSAAKPMPNFDDIELDVDEPPPMPSRPSLKAPRASPAPSDDLSLGSEARSSPASPSADGESPEPGTDFEPLKIGGFKTGPLKDPFEGMNLGESGTASPEFAKEPRKENPAETAKAAAPAAPQPAPEVAPGRDMVSSALTGLVGAALAIAVLIVAALSDDTSAGLLGFGPASDVVATRVVSGLYDTAAGKPVFFVRGRIENHGKKMRGPVRVTAELSSEGASEMKAEVIAGAEPNAEDVWSLRSQADVDKLNRALEVSPVERKLRPGSSLPFFALISDPPPDLLRHRLHLKVESVDAWVPPAVRTGKGR